MTIPALLHRACMLRGARRGHLVRVALAAALLAGCEEVFHPIQPTADTPFSMFGFLDLRADTQMIRVMPVRATSVTGPEPIDAVVMLEHVGSGRTVTLSDSLVRYPVRELDDAVYAHNFWTAEPLEPGETYRITATRSDGAATTALVAMPPELRIDYLSGPAYGADNALLRIHAARLLYVDMIYAILVDSSRQRAPSISVRQATILPGDTIGTIRLSIDGGELEILDHKELFRREIRIVAASAEWPFHPGLSDLEISLPDKVPTNVENGVGFVGAVARWTIPLHNCKVLEVGSDGAETCEHRFDPRSASVRGRMLRKCGEPETFWPIRLTERSADGGTVIRAWRTGWNGEYRFEGIEPGAALLMDFQTGGPELSLPPLAPGEHFVVDDFSSPIQC